MNVFCILTRVVEHEQGLRTGVRDVVGRWTLSRIYTETLEKELFLHRYGRAHILCLTVRLSSSWDNVMDLNACTMIALRIDAQHAMEISLLRTQVFIALGQWHLEAMRLRPLQCFM